MWWARNPEPAISHVKEPNFENISSLELLKNNKLTLGQDRIPRKRHKPNRNCFAFPLLLFKMAATIRMQNEFPPKATVTWLVQRSRTNTGVQSRPSVIFPPRCLPFLPLTNTPRPNDLTECILIEHGILSGRKKVFLSSLQRQSLRIQGYYFCDNVCHKCGFLAEKRSVVSYFAWKCPQCPLNIYSTYLPLL